jgi:hypothetical protein
MVYVDSQKKHDNPFFRKDQTGIQAPARAFTEAALFKFSVNVKVNDNRKDQREDLVQGVIREPLFEIFEYFLRHAHISSPWSLQDFPWSGYPVFLRLDKLVAQGLREFLARQSLCQPAADSQGYQTRLFGNDQDDGIRLFADTQGRPVPDPQGMAKIRILRQRKQTTRRRQGIALDDNAAVMQRRRRRKNGLYQFRRDPRLDQDAAINIALEPILPLDRDDPADSSLGKIKQR